MNEKELTPTEKFFEMVQTPEWVKEIAILITANLAKGLEHLPSSEKVEREEILAVLSTFLDPAAEANGQMYVAAYFLTALPSEKLPYEELIMMFRDLFLRDDDLRSDCIKGLMQKIPKKYLTLAKIFETFDFDFSGVSNYKVNVLQSLIQEIPSSACSVEELVQVDSKTPFSKTSNLILLKTYADKIHPSKLTLEFFSSYQDTDRLFESIVLRGGANWISFDELWEVFAEVDSNKSPVDMFWKLLLVHHEDRIGWEFLMKHFIKIPNELKPLALHLIKQKFISDLTQTRSRKHHEDSLSCFLELLYGVCDKNVGVLKEMFFSLPDLLEESKDEFVEMLTDIQKNAKCIWIVEYRLREKPEHFSINELFEILEYSDTLEHQNILLLEERNLRESLKTNESEFTFELLNQHLENIDSRKGMLALEFLLGQKMLARVSAQDIFRFLLVPSEKLRSEVRKQALDEIQAEVWDYIFLRGYFLRSRDFDQFLLAYELLCNFFPVNFLPDAIFREKVAMTFTREHWDRLSDVMNKCFSDKMGLLEVLLPCGMNNKANGILQAVMYWIVLGQQPELMKDEYLIWDECPFPHIKMMMEQERFKRMSVEELMKAAKEVTDPEVRKKFAAAILAKSGFMWVPRILDKMPERQITGPVFVQRELVMADPPQFPADVLDTDAPVSDAEDQAIKSDIGESAGQEDGGEEKPDQEVPYSSKVQFIVEDD